LYAATIVAIGGTRYIPYLAYICCLLGVA
jgi:hypothetical protein